MYTDKMQVTSMIFHGKPRETVLFLFYTMPQKIQWPTHAQGMIRRLDILQSNIQRLSPYSDWLCFLRNVINTRCATLSSGIPGIIIQSSYTVRIPIF